nr:LysM peptidoglycan-binding domain-containing protein [Bifidobacterium leontopitheci]
MLAFMAGVMLPHPAQSVADPQLVTSYTVQPGDTLWSYAESITPDGGDVRDTVSRLVQLNHLDDDSLETGQRLLVPVE